MSKENKNNKEHADWQDDYRRSSNFPSLTEQEAKKLKPTGTGSVKLKEKK